jgi:glycosyltransferase involved in cell wall biosynthesis
MYHNIRILAQEHEVHVIAFVENDEERERVSGIAGICSSVKAIQRMSNISPNHLSLNPAQVPFFDTPAMHRAVNEACQRLDIHVLQCEYLEMAQFHRPGLFTVWSLIETLSPNARQQLRSERGPAAKIRACYQWMALLNYETSAAKRFDRVVTMTPRDAEYLRSYVPQVDIRMIPIGVDADHYVPSEVEPGDSLRVLFLGNFRHRPNIEAVRFLKDHLMPVFPDIRFQVAGDNLPAGVLHDTEAEVLGYLADTRPLYKRPNTVVVAPLFSGTGQRVKLLEAFAMGVPVVTTSRGASGLAVRHGTDAFIAETPDEFRAALTTLRDSRELRQNVGENARRMVTDRFDWDVLADRFLDVVKPDEGTRANH